jgi:DNA-cytosine methyltransferase
MIKYSCNNCSKDFKQKSQYDRHINKKNPCIQKNKVAEKIIELKNEYFDKIDSDKEYLNEIEDEDEDYLDEKDYLDEDDNNEDEDYLNEDDYLDISEDESDDESDDESEDNKNKLNALDLFCGCGGMSKGLTDAGINIIAGIDYWDKAVESYKKNNTHIGICADLTKLPPEEFQKKYNHKNKKIDIIVGGPPCQGMSIAGKRDIKDPRNSLFMEYVKYLNYYNPKAFIMENVMGILSMKNANGEKIIDIIMGFFNKNYNCVICKLYASDFEVPQNRRRVIIIGIRKDLKIIPTEPKSILSESNRIPVKNILLPKDKIDKSYYLSEKAITGIKNKKIKALENKNGFGAQYLDLNKPSFTIPARYWKDGYDALVKYSETEIRRLTISLFFKLSLLENNL